MLSKIIISKYFISKEADLSLCVKSSRKILCYAVLEKVSNDKTLLALFVLLNLI